MASSGIGSYGLLSDCQSAALVNLDGWVDWWCPGRFDAPSVFARLLDCDAGHWSIRPAAEYKTRRAYVGRSLVLRTVFDTATGSVAVTDALTLTPGAHGHDIGKRVPHTLVRLVEGLAGTVATRMRWTPRFDYGRSVPQLTEVDGGVRAAVGPATLLLSATTTLHCDGDAATAEFEIDAGQRIGFALAYTRTYGTTGAARLDPAQAVADTVAAWESWAELHTGYEGRYPKQVQRSAIVLQGLTYQPSGAVVAAPTTSLPERLGGDSNYDYRFAWLRDFTLTMRALWVAACPDEVDALFAWVARSVGRVDPGPVPIMYGVEGERDLTERTLEHLAGFAGSRPVRVGNDAWRQRQLDVLGEILDAAYLLRDQLAPFDPELQGLLIGLADQARGWNEQVGAYTGAFGSGELDASVLILPLVGFLPATDPRMRATIDAVERTLGGGGLVRRWATDPDTGALLGNFPQAFSHVGLINAAWRLTQTTNPGQHRPGHRTRKDTP